MRASHLATIVVATLAFLLSTAAAQTPPPAPPPGATPPAATPPAATPPPDTGGAPAAVPTTATPESTPAGIRLRNLEQRVQQLKEQAWRVKARVQMLKEAVLGGGIG